MAQTLDKFKMLFNYNGDPRSWSTSVLLRWVSVDIITFSETLHPTYEELAEQCDIVCSFVHACQLSLNLVLKEDPAWYPLELCIVRQYVVVVCLRFYDWAQRRPGNSRDERNLKSSLEKLGSALKDVRKVLQPWFRTAGELDIQRAPEIAQEWLVMTIFHPVIAALAHRFQTASPQAAGPQAFLEHVQSTETGRDWMAATQRLRPRAMLMNFTDRVVGKSVARWQGRSKEVSPFELWEKRGRAGGMGETRKLLEKARDALLPLSSRHRAPSSIP